jgi:LysM repeat protein
VKHFPFKRQFLFAAAALLLVLSACVMPFPGSDEEAPEVVPTADTIIIPTAPPVVEPTAVPETTTETGETTTETTEETSEVEEPAAETPSETESEETAAEPTGEITHIVKSGETLGQIALQYDVSIEDIAAANNISDLDALEVGQELIIKAGAAAESGGEETTSEGGELVHIVQAGENLFRIGLRYGFTAEELAAYNDIPDVTRIDVGQIIKIPPK